MNRSKPPTELSLDLLRLALSIIEGPSLKVDGVMFAGLRGRRFRRLKEIGGLELASRSSWIVCQECERRHRTPVTTDPERRAATIFCPEAGRVPIDSGMLEVYELQLEWLLGSLFRLLRVPGRQRPITWIDGHLWELGEVSIEGRHLRILFARQVNTMAMLEQVRAQLDRLAGKGKTGAVLTASPGFRVPHRLPNAYSILDIGEIIAESGEHISIDRRRLLTMVEPEAVVDRYKSGSRGAPTSKDLYLGELQRRIDAGTAFVNKDDEAAHLKQWVAENHPSARQPALKTVKNNIARLHCVYRTRKLFRPE